MTRPCLRCGRPCTGKLCVRCGRTPIADLLPRLLECLRGHESELYRALREEASP